MWLGPCLPITDLMHFIVSRSVISEMPQQVRLKAKIFGGNVPTKWRHRVASASPRVGRNMGGESSPQPTGGHELSQRGPGRSPGWEHILAYFEGHRTFLFAPICRCFEFVKQCFMSYLGRSRCLGAKPMFGGNWS